MRLARALRLDRCGVARPTMACAESRRSQLAPTLLRVRWRIRPHVDVAVGTCSRPTTHTRADMKRARHSSRCERFFAAPQAGFMSCAFPVVARRRILSNRGGITVARASGCSASVRSPDHADQTRSGATAVATSTQPAQSASVPPDVSPRVRKREAPPGWFDGTTRSQELRDTP